MAVVSDRMLAIAQELEETATCIREGVYDGVDALADLMNIDRKLVSQLGRGGRTYADRRREAIAFSKERWRRGRKVVGR